MNLRVDLILESEQRSASAVSAKSLMRIGTIVLPVILCLLLAWGALATLKVKADATALEDRYAAAQPRQLRAVEISDQYRENTATQDTLNGWRNSRIDWHEQLIGLAKAVPAEMQILKLQVDHSFQTSDSGIPARVFKLTLNGKAIGLKSEQNVQVLERRLAGNAPFGDAVREVEVPKYGADTSEGAGKYDRVFQIVAYYNEREFE